MNDLFSVFADVMLWGSIPLLGGLAVWEHQLILSNTNHVLVQLVMVLIVFGWAAVWFAIGQNRRIANRSMARDEHNVGPTHPAYSSSSREETFTEKIKPEIYPVETDSSLEGKQGIYGSNN